jgi:hypothetical protein
MKTSFHRTIVIASAMAALCLGVVRTAAAHCDTLNGSVANDARAALAADFEQVERGEMSESVYQRYEALARELAGA